MVILGMLVLAPTMTITNTWNAPDVERAIRRLENANAWTDMRVKLANVRLALTIATTEVFALL
jgi:hypothetical protein